MNANRRAEEECANKRFPASQSLTHALRRTYVTNYKPIVTNNTAGSSCAISLFLVLLLLLKGK